MSALSTAGNSQAAADTIAASMFAQWLQSQGTTTDTKGDKKPLGVQAAGAGAGGGAANAAAAQTIGALGDTAVAAAHAAGVPVSLVGGVMASQPAGSDILGVATSPDQKTGPMHLSQNQFKNDILPGLTAQDKQAIQRLTGKNADQLNMNDPRDNVVAGAFMLKELMQQNAADPLKTLNDYGRNVMGLDPSSAQGMKGLSTMAAAMLALNELDRRQAVKPKPQPAPGGGGGGGGGDNGGGGGGGANGANGGGGRGANGAGSGGGAKGAGGGGDNGGAAGANGGGDKAAGGGDKAAAGGDKAAGGPQAGDNSGKGQDAAAGADKGKDKGAADGAAAATGPGKDVGDSGPVDLKDFKTAGDNVHFQNPKIEAHRDEILKAYHATGIPPEIIGAQMWHESRGNMGVTTTNSDGTKDVGLMQIGQKRAGEYMNHFGLSGSLDVNNPADNIMAGALEIKYWLQQSGGDLKGAFNGYVSGDVRGGNGIGDSNYANNCLRYIDMIRKGQALPDNE